MVFDQRRIRREEEKTNKKKMNTIKIQKQKFR